MGLSSRISSASLPFDARTGGIPSCISTLNATSSRQRRSSSRTRVLRERFGHGAKLEFMFGLLWSKHGANPYVYRPGRGIQMPESDVSDMKSGGSRSVGVQQIAQEILKSCRNFSFGDGRESAVLNQPLRRDWKGEEISGQHDDLGP